MDNRIRWSTSLLVVLLLSGCAATPASPSPQPSSTPPAVGATAPSVAPTPAPAGAPTVVPASVASSPVAREPLRVGYSSLTASNYLAYVTKGAGLLDKYGIDGQMLFFPPATITAASVAGDVDVAYSSSANVPTANVGGADLVAIGAVVQHPFFAIVARNGINSLDDLNGKRVAATQVGATTDILIKQLIATRPLTNVSIVYLPDATAQLAALQTGQVDAVVNSEPQTSLSVAQGAHVIYDQSSSGEKFVGTLLVVRRPYLATHRDLLKRFLMASLEGIHLMKSDPAAASQYPGPYLKITDAAVLLHSMESQDRVTDDDLNIPLDAYQSVLDLVAVSVPAVKTLRPQDLVDLSLLDEIKASGFMDRLSK